jgi:prolipoprotein diacylglyceryltransferase
LVSTVASDFQIHAAPHELTALVVAEARARLDIIVDQLSSITDNERFFERIVAIAKDASAQGHDQVVATLKPLLTAYYPSQILQALTDGPILLGLMILIWLKPRKPGVIGGWFLIIYGVLRMATEIFRQPDEGVTPIFGLSRGQALSAIMIISGIIGLFIVARREGPRLGGLFAGTAKPTDQPDSTTPA